jgi:glycosyltransferase involved in cell wall biosynthesis
VEVHLAADAAAMAHLAMQAPAGAVHVCQGVRGNGRIAIAQQRLRQRRVRYWVIMETVADRGRMIGSVKRWVYRRLFLHQRDAIEGVLAIGAVTPAWVAARGVPAQRIFPFAYFLAPHADVGDAAPTKAHLEIAGEAESGARVLFVGRLIALKQLGVLIDALAALKAFTSPAFRLLVVGDGPMRPVWQRQAAQALGDCVEWLGTQPMPVVRRIMQQADCLVLPSRRDGWGAVVSEALMAGTPAICSDACGAAEVVRASGVGGVFPAGDAQSLSTLLAPILRAGLRTPAARRALAEWAQCLGADAGAGYLERILVHAAGQSARPVPPWQAEGVFSGKDDGEG